MSGRTVSHPRVLICEGADDIAFFRAIIRGRSIPEFDVRDTRDPSDGHTGAGKTKYARALRALRSERGFEDVTSIVLVGDNDEDPEASFQNICLAIEEAEFGASPQRPLEKVRYDGRVWLTIIMIPWTDQIGCLESLCVEAARAADPESAKLVDDFAAAVGTHAWASDMRRGKMWLRSSLAARWERDPCVYLGRAFRSANCSHLIPVEHSSFDRIMDFLATCA